MKIGQQGNPNPSKSTRFKKGKAWKGNAIGPRLKRNWTVKSLIEMALDEKDTATGETNRKLLIHRLINMTIRGDISA